MIVYGCSVVVVNSARVGYVCSVWVVVIVQRHGLLFKFAVCGSQHVLIVQGQGILVMFAVCGLWL